MLEDWIRTDGLQALKVKLRGDDAEWDYRRLAAVGAIAARHPVLWLSADFNCTVTEPEYVNGILDRLRDDEPRTYAAILYVEQPFPTTWNKHRIDVRSVAARKPLFMDESAHDWTLVRLGRSLGWSGVALKTCKTQTGAILSLCWARHHGMTLMVQDLTNPMLAQVPHLQLAAHAGTIMGVETNAMQFYPAASAAEERVHPGALPAARRARGPGIAGRERLRLPRRRDRAHAAGTDRVTRHTARLPPPSSTPSSIARAVSSLAPAASAWRRRSPSLQPSSAASNSATRGTHARAARQSTNASRVRRASTSSTVHAASWRAAYTTSASR